MLFLLNALPYFLEKFYSQSLLKYIIEIVLKAFKYYEFIAGNDSVVDDLCLKIAF